ncbi:MAG: SDR family oxidoreductase [Microthrixaceae bacterium]|nr:SDR family oxidoreductase [Microthrixaceae bacterium]
MGRFDEKVSIITGAGQGIGEGYAVALAEEGAAVVVADINLENASRVAAAIEALGGKAAAIQVDVSDPDSCMAMAEATIERFGRIDHLVNNAAIYHGMQIESMLRVDLDYYHRFMEVNLNGALYCSRAVWKHMRAVGGGAIVNQTSTAAWMAAGFYAVAKAGLNSMTINLAAELAGRNIRVNAIAPGPTDTEATHIVAGGKEHTDILLGDVMIKRMGTPKDLANMLMFLLSDEASWITGQIIAVDGGQSKRI